MSSILTNNGAMVALQTLKGVNSNLAKTQSEISTGKSVASAKDNAAVWAISKTMESDVEGFKGIKDSLALGESAVGVARQAAETVTDLLTKVKGKIVSAQTANSADRLKIQADIDNYEKQIGSVVKASQVNGLNLVDGSSSTPVSFLSSLDRDSTGTVTSKTIDVARKDLSIGTYAAKAAFTAGTGVTAAQDAQAFNLDAGANETIVIDAGAGFAAGDQISIRIGDREASYTVTAADAAATTPSDIVAVGLKSAVESLGITGLTVDYDSGTVGQLTLANASPTLDLAVTAQFKNQGSGALGALGGLTVNSDANAKAALGTIETLIKTATDAAASFGSSQTQIETQSKFISKLSDAMTSGIGSMVDADMEEASARLQALQTQQQLGIQALSIANQAPQSIMSLFR